MCDFLTLKMSPLALALITTTKQKKKHFLPIGQKMLILHEKIELLMAKENFPLKKGNFEPIGQKDGNGNIFRL